MIKPEVRNPRWWRSQLLDKIATQFQYAIEVLDPENVVVAVGTELLSSLEAEIYVLPVSTRFGGRHLVFPTSDYIGQFSQ